MAAITYLYSETPNSPTGKEFQNTLYTLPQNKNPLQNDTVPTGSTQTVYQQNSSPKSSSNNPLAPNQQKFPPTNQCLQQNSAPIINQTMKNPLIPNYGPSQLQINPNYQQGAMQGDSIPQNSFTPPTRLQNPPDNNVRREETKIYRNGQFDMNPLSQEAKGQIYPDLKNGMNSANPRQNPMAMGNGISPPNNQYMTGMPTTGKDVLSAGRELIRNLLQKNPVCADCTAANPTWLSANIGCLVCTLCCSVHRNFGRDISRMRSLMLDKIPAATIEKVFGNKLVNDEFEYCVPTEFLKPHETSSMEDRKHYITAKYCNQTFRRRPGMARWGPKIAPPSLKSNKTILDLHGVLAIHLKTARNTENDTFFVEFSHGDQKATSNVITPENINRFSDHLKLNLTKARNDIGVKMYSQGLLKNTLIGEGTIKIADFGQDIVERFEGGEDVQNFLQFEGKDVMVTFNLQKIEK